MARFDVYRNPGSHAGTTPYLVDVQTDLLDGLETRVVIPLRRADQFSTKQLPKDLTPVFLIEDVPCILETPKLAAVPSRMLKTPVMSLLPEQDHITGALDRLFYGF